MSILSPLAQGVSQTIQASLSTRWGRYRSWPGDRLLIDEPLALAEHQTNRLQRLYANATRDTWDGPTVFREAVARHQGLQLSREKRIALSYPISMLMWGELGAWIVSAELAERLDDADARMAASSQVFDEARHFYILRDYLALLHVPPPRLSPYFVIGVRKLLSSRDLNLKLFAMQILAEGTAQSIFSFIADAQIEPVLSDILPFIERDEARHVGLGITHLPERLGQLSPKKCRQLSHEVRVVGNLFAATQISYIDHYQALGLDPRDLFKKADKLLHGLSQKLGNVPGTEQPYFRTDNPLSPEYEQRLSFVLPPPGQQMSWLAQRFRKLIEFGDKMLPN